MIVPLSDEEALGTDGAPAPVVDTLSDDDCDQIRPPLHRAASSSAASSSSRKQAERVRKVGLSAEEVSHHSKRLRAVVYGKCKCKGNVCRLYWREHPDTLDSVLQKRIMLKELPKLEADREAQWDSQLFFLI